MKIRFIRPFRLYNPVGDDVMMGEGAIENMEKEDYAQWLIDNGFAEEVKESGWWKPKYGEEYFYVGLAGSANSCIWTNDGVDNGRLKLGFVFKTEEAAIHCRDYLIAVATVRQDEGVLTPEQIYELGRNNGEAYHIGCTDKQNGEEVLGVCEMDLYFWPPVGVVLFDTKEHAQASLDEHPDEWKIIANYDWSRE